MQVPAPELDAGVIEPGATAPLHRQLERGLRRLIHTGAVEPGTVLPGEHELAAHFGVSRHTVRHALGVLAGEGLLQRQRGRGGGTRVLLPPARIELIERSLGSFYAFAWEVQARGGRHHSYVLERSVTAATAEVALNLEVEAGTPLERIVRLRTADGDPLVVETAYFPVELVVGLNQIDLEQGAIYDAIERVHGVRVERARETLRPITLARPVARLLGVKTGAPALAVERQTFAAAGPIEWQESIVRGDRFRYSVELQRSQP
jgi:GntR family transcriptional regulator